MWYFIFKHSERGLQDNKHLMYICNLKSDECLRLFFVRSTDHLQPLTSLNMFISTKLTVNTSDRPFSINVINRIENCLRIAVITALRSRTNLPAFPVKTFAYRLCTASFVSHRSELRTVTCSRSSWCVSEAGFVRNYVQSVVPALLEGDSFIPNPIERYDTRSVCSVSVR